MSEPWTTDRWWVAPANYAPEVRQAMSLPARVLLHDVTLRDGEQTPGVVFRLADKVRIARMLDDLGVARIEAGMPASGAEDADAIREIVALGLRARIFAFTRGVPEDVERAIACGVHGLIIEAPTGVPRLRYQYPHLTEDQIINNSVAACARAKERGLEAVFFPMDGTRAEPAFFDRLIGAVARRGQPDAIALVDTHACTLPQAVAWLVRRIKDQTGLRVEIHTHTDLGMGVANSLAAVTAGAEVVHCAINGIGERTGNAPLEEVVVAAEALLGISTGVDWTKLQEASALVHELSRFPVPYNKPVVGLRAFSRESGSAIELTRDFPLALFCVNPAALGREAECLLGKKSSVQSVRLKAAQLGAAPLDDAAAAEVLQRVKMRATESKELVGDDDFRAILAQVRPAGHQPP
jgi:methanogen homocitrate synthase